MVNFSSSVKQFENSQRSEVMWATILTIFLLDGGECSVAGFGVPLVLFDGLSDFVEELVLLSLIVMLDGNI